MNKEERRELPEKQNSVYDAGKTQAAKAAAIGEIVALQTELTRRNPIKTNLADVSAVKAVAENVMQECARVGLLPNMEILASSLGLSRRGLYDYLSRHSDTETADYITTLQTAWAGLRQMAADRGAASETMSIFVLLNSSLGFTNQHSVEIVQPNTPLEQMDAETARKRLVDAMPFDYEGDTEEKH